MWRYPSFKTSIKPEVMKTKVRNSIFETNSSSEHSLVLMNRENYRKWKNGDLLARVKEHSEDGNTWGNFWSYMYELEFTEDNSSAAMENAILLQKIVDERVKSLELYKKGFDNRDKDYDCYTFDETHYNSETAKWKNMGLDLYKENEMSIDDGMWMTYDEFYNSYIRNNDCDSPFEHDSTEQGIHIIGNYYHS